MNFNDTKLCALNPLEFTNEGADSHFASFLNHTMELQNNINVSKPIGICSKCQGNLTLLLKAEIKQAIYEDRLSQKLVY